MSWFDRRPPEAQVKLSLRGVHSHQCKKPNCKSPTRIQRHHIRSERMWLRHFKHKYRTNKYKAFKQRYTNFLAQDVVPLCEDHHEEVHEYYEREQGKFLAENPELFRKFSTWEWKDAERLMDCFSRVFNSWIGVETPGSSSRRFVRGTTQERRADARKRFRRQ